MSYNVKMQSEPHTIEGRPLGRVLEHDERSRSYAYRAAPSTVLRSIRHERKIPVLDQGNLGSCTGNAMTGLLGTIPFWDMLPLKALSATDETYDETVAVTLYSSATKLDTYDGTYPPDDTGSSGVAVAKAAKKKGWISGYQHTFDLQTALAALAVTPVIIGINWYHGFDNPDANGLVVISGNIRGGHEVVLDELDVEQQLVWFTNSWSTDYGVDGRACMSWADFERLLSEDGDCTVPVLITSPAPTPTPVPVPTPSPTPDAPFLDAHPQLLAHLVAGVNRGAFPSVDAYVVHILDGYFRIRE